MLKRRLLHQISSFQFWQPIVPNGELRLVDGPLPVVLPDSVLHLLICFLSLLVGFGDAPSSVALLLLDTALLPEVLCHS